MTANTTKKTIVLAGGLVIAILILFGLKEVFSGASATLPSFDDENADVVLNNGVQEVTLTLDPETLDYAPNPIRLKAGIPVRIAVDLGSVRGCTASVRIPAFGIQKRAIPGDNVIEFTPDKPGTYPFSCSMGMSQGLIVVE